MLDYVTWKDSYSVGDPLLDAEHKQIIESIDKLYLPMQGRTPGLAAERLMDHLAQYTRDHFAHEEGRLKDVAYTSLAAHKALHDGMMRRTVELQSQWMSLTPCDVLQFLKDWWLEHIQFEDKKFVGYLGALRLWSDPHLCQ